MPAPVNLTRRLLVGEVVIVLALSLGRSGVYSVVQLVAAATAPGTLRSQTASLNASAAPGRPWLDLTYQLLGIGFRLTPVVLVLYLLVRSGDSPRALLAGTGRRLQDLGRGAALAAGVGAIGVAFYVLTHELGLDLTVVATSLPDVWWRYPVLVLSAAQNAVLEEVLVLGYLLARLRQLDVSPGRSLAVSALLRGSYHLYQGIGGFVANAVMGVLFGVLYRRWGRVTPLVVTHTLLDVGAFVGYAVLSPHFSWLRS